MKRTTVISPQENCQQQQQTATETSDVKSKTAIVASLPIDRSRPVHPYSSLSLSPNGQHALVAGKDTIQLVTVGPNGLETLKSFNIAHHFYPPSSPGSNETRQQQHKYGDVRDAFQQQSVTAGVTNMNLNQQYGNIIVTKVAWSNNYYCPPGQRQHPTQRNISDISDAGIDNSLPTSNTETKEGGKQHKGRIRRRKKRRGKKETDEDKSDYVGNDDHDLETMAESFVAAAGSNGVVVVWRTKRLLFSNYGETKSKSARFTIASSSSSSSPAHLAKQQRTQQPEGILDNHTRAVNGLAWHPLISGLLLTASQDATIKLWERRAVAKHSRPDGQKDKGVQEKEQQQQQQQRSWFSTMVGGVVGSGYKNASRLDPTANDDVEENKYSWRCKATYSVGEQDAVRDISWNKLLPDIFGAVTASGNFVIYNMHVSFKALVKIAAHTGFASSLDFHPQRPYVVATGGSADRSVKIWNLESSLEYFVNHNSNRNGTHQHNMHDNANTWNTAKSDVSNNSASSSESQPSNKDSPIRGTASSWSMGGKHTKSTTSAFPKHVLSISASVTQVRWRPPSNEFLPLLSDSFNNSTSHDYRDDKKQEVMVDRHDSMLAVATARLTSAGGSGALSLWSYNRPYMSLSIVEGHEEGAIEDFVWLKTPKTIPKTEILQQNFTVRSDTPDSPSLRLRKNSESPTLMDDSSLGVKERTQKDDEQAVESSPISFIWQNVLSVGRDGQCIMQSFARGERRIRSVPSSCFAIANFSPFQPGSGSLQCFSVYQDVPNRINDDFMLTALRQDEYTAKAPGVFREDDIQNHTAEKEEKMQDGGKVFPSSVPQLSFSVVDQGSLDKNGMPIVNDKDLFCVAPEVVHLSRFARLYKLYPDASCPSRVDLCLYNSKVAEELRCGPLARMWKTVSSLLRGSGLEELPSKTPTEPTNVFQFVIFPTIKSLLLERAEAGDVQTNVALCEVLQVIDSGGEQTRIPSLRMKLVREWYLSYIDLLHHMCLFSAAALLIKNCRDKAIGSLSQQSTTIHESCPRCCRPIESSTGSFDNGRQVCKNCRRRVGMCFLCHEPVTGMFVWCPGCGHGGHMEHALQWFGGSNGKPIRTVCPTGCGHRCNFVQMATAFPRTMSMTFSDTSSTDQCKFIPTGS
mmetsp:Transcript_62676/g.70081  ORF Transcript_62676/g.70081 Transcript_62676/m.70081 type:complete len:1140 (+) Transcript_62676:51-3470(+)